MSAAYLSRIQTFQKNLASNQVVLLSKPADIFYFTGFVTLVPEEREAYFLVSPTTAEVFHTSFSPVSKVAGISYTASTDLAGVSKKITELTRTAPEVAARAAGEAARVTSADQQSNQPSEWYLLLDYNSLFVQEFKVLEKIEKIVVEQFSSQKIWRQRMVKDQFEITAIQKASTLTQHAFRHIQSFIEVGKTELEVAWELENFIKTHGGVLAFPTIVAYGAHAALPHHQPTTTPLAPEMPVLIDFGAKVDNYCSDMTRTFWFGTQPTAQFIEVERVVKEAYAAALAICERFVYEAKESNGSIIQISEVDLAARNVLEKAGYEKHFIHTTGHGLGIEIHEQPSVYKNTTTLLEADMIFTIEPGVYLPEEIGYRHENTILLTQEKVIELTK